METAKYNRRFTFVKINGVHTIRCELTINGKLYIGHSHTSRDEAESEALNSLIYQKPSGANRILRDIHGYDKIMGWSKLDGMTTANSIIGNN